jgi:hypothetical protein
MKAYVTAFALLVFAVPANAHFVWILPPEQPGQPVRIVFSDSLQPDKPELLKKISQTKLMTVDDRGAIAALQLTDGKDALQVTLPARFGTGVVLGVCPYGVVQRGQAEPFLLNYYPKSVVGASSANELRYACDKLPLQVVVNSADSAQVLWHGKPLAGAEVVVLKVGQEKTTECKSGDDGSFALGKLDASLVGIRVSHIEATTGALNGKPYKSIKHYATFTFSPKSLSNAVALVANSRNRSDEAGKPAENLAATKLLADARAARANWENFPGFSADLEVNFDGKAAHGTMTVDPKGKVTVQVAESAESAWAKRMLGSIVGHRLSDGTEDKTPCAFADEVTDHPLGRAVRVLNDEFHSSYRIRDRQVIEVNRVMKDARFTITVIENRLNEEKQYLPATYVVNYWDTKSGALQRAEGHHQTWQRIGRFDLPLTAMVITSLPGKQETKELKLSNIHLSQANR